MRPPLEDEHDEAAWNTLREVQRAMFQRPVATQAIFSALVAEGRRYAETAEGAALREALSHSEQVHRARILWEIVTMSAFEEAPPRMLPSAILESLVRAATDSRLEERAADLAEQLDV